METQIKAAGYIRVSTKKQVDDESLTTQQGSITSFVKQQGYKLPHAIKTSDYFGTQYQKHPCRKLANLFT